MSAVKHSRGLNILGITPDPSFIRCLRLEMPLMNMKKNGLIDGFFIADSNLTYVPDDVEFNALWLQRVENADLIQYLSEGVNNKYLYDIDDLLIGKRSYGDALYNIERVGVKQALSRCKVLTVTTERLGGLLEVYSQSSLAAKTFVCPNGFEYPYSLRVPKIPEGLWWASSDYAALTSSREPILKAISEFAKENDLIMYCSGVLDEDIKSAFAKIIDLGMVSYWHHKTILASLPAMIGVAPLETHADQATLDFINGKSDLKMTEFGGFGHSGVYSQALPYVDTELQTGVLVENTQKAWAEGLEYIYRQGWQKAQEEQKRIIAHRHMDRLVRECWWPAIGQVLLDHPISGRELKLGMPKLKFNAQWYLKRYPDVLKSGMDPYEHYIQYGQKEGRFPGP